MSIESDIYSPEREAESELEGLIGDFGVLEPKDLMTKVKAKIRKSGTPAAIEAEVRRLGRELPGVEEEDRAAYWTEYLGGSEDDLADDAEVEGYGDHESM
jgi:hypothetical protein